MPGWMFHIRPTFLIVNTAVLDRCRISRVTFSLRDVPVHVLYFLQPRCNTPGFIENERFVVNNQCFVREKRNEIRLLLRHDCVGILYPDWSFKSLNDE